MRLNLGCGEFPAEGWINVDARELPGVNEVVDLTALPYLNGSAALVYAGHVFEHLTYLDQLPRALAEVKRVLAPDGTVMVVGPDLDRALVHFPHEVKGMWPTDPEGALLEAHSWPCTAPMMRAALHHAGLTARELPIADVPESWPVVSRIAWQFALEAHHA